MLSSLATFLFGTQQATSESQHTEENPENLSNVTNKSNDLSGEDVIEVTSSTPSVPSNRGTLQLSGRTNRRDKQRPKDGKSKKPLTIKKLLAPSENSLDEDIDEEWYIVEKEDEETDSLPRSDSEEEISVGEIQAKTSPPSAVAPAVLAAAAASRRLQQRNSRCLYTGPRPQQQRNFLQRSRAQQGIKILSPPKNVDNGVSQSLFAPSPASSPCGSDASLSMEDSWYVTPPPCFTSSIGSINMEASPYENLLIEHPSMSVYRSIRCNKECSDKPTSRDLRELQATQQREPTPPPTAPIVEQKRGHSAHYDRHAEAQLKQQTLVRHGQKSNNKKQHQQLCRSAMNRSNKVRDLKANRQRRSDMQHFKVLSGANNNRKCAF
ncbi:tumor protein p53-inducible nuclear protein 2 isoform X1 [Scaptodrosophila lebanonensis]|uniref:Tumor protein p53-inducible nuclear protein 2 isoform X1 n=1 Tax=Drosophila lebanonensis TaxID=7225 RepID=A0A6J2UCQ3_DROLE|nr:tumor protein p53-inducible nuclear protein 2 isoform X1 [Scaptodrosophila lebanonensis]XP_030385866.1 tumor protein p53-inducible nuclear protein 2 isoform X1 [Scaptodrosophila lebanonensis]